MLFFIVGEFIFIKRELDFSHLDYSLPSNHQKLNSLPGKVHARFKFPIFQNSYFRITKNGIPISNGETFFDKDSLGMYYLFHKNLGKGKYLVHYEVFFFGNGSEKGFFEFEVD